MVNTKGLADDIIVLKQNGDYLSARKMIKDKHQYCEKQIRFPHNIQKMLNADVFYNWDKNYER